MSPNTTVRRLERLMEKSRAAAPDTWEGAEQIRSALVGFLSFTGQEVRSSLRRPSGAPSRRQPNIGVIRDHDGVEVRTLCPIRLEGGELRKGRADSYFLRDELARSVAEDGLQLGAGRDGYLLIARHCVPYAGLPFHDDVAREYIRDHAREWAGDQLVTLDVTFSMPALQWYIEVVGSRYLWRLSPREGE